MPTFLIVPIHGEGHGKLEKAIVDNIGKGNFYKLPDAGWVVNYSGTSKALSDILGITDGVSGSAVVASISGYYGRAPTDLWEWLKINWSST